jgi:hypothetical protein
MRHGLIYNNAIPIDDSSFEAGSLQKMSYIRPGKLFTGNSKIIEKCVGTIRAAVISELIAKVVALKWDNPQTRNGTTIPERGDL